VKGSKEGRIASSDLTELFSDERKREREREREKRSENIALQERVTKVLLGWVSTNTRGALKKMTHSSTAIYEEYKYRGV